MYRDRNLTTNHLESYRIGLEHVIKGRIYGKKQYNKTCVKRPLSKRPTIGIQDQLSLYAGQEYRREGEYSAILSTFIKQP